jgi:hypothetical protein
MTHVLTLSLSVHLSVTRIAIEALYCSREFVYRMGYYDQTACSEDSALIIFRCIAGVFLVIFVLPLPPVLYWIISKNKPQGSPENPDITYDDDGMETPFTDEIYHYHVENDPVQIACPYRCVFVSLFV